MEYRFSWNVLAIDRYVSDQPVLFSFLDGFNCQLLITLVMWDPVKFFSVRVYHVPCLYGFGGKYEIGWLVSEH